MRTICVYATGTRLIIVVVLNVNLYIRVRFLEIVNALDFGVIIS